MSNNCLVTKLKGAVNNDSLDIFGAFYFTIKSGNAQFNIGMSAHCQMFINGDGYFSDSTYTQNLGKTLTGEIASTHYYVVSATGCRIGVLDPTYEVIFNLYGVKNTDINFDYILPYRKFTSASITASQVSGVSGKMTIEKIKYPEIMSSLANNSLGYTFNIDSVPSKFNPTVLKTFEFNNNYNNVIGNISVFNEFYLLDSLMLNATSVEGDVESLFVAWYNAGKRGNMRRADFKVSNCTFNGQSITTRFVPQFNDDGVLVYDTNNVLLGSYNGSTQTWSYNS